MSFDSHSSNAKNSDIVLVDKKVFSTAVADFKRISDFKNIQLVINCNSVGIRSRMMNGDFNGDDFLEIESKSSVTATLNLTVSMLDIIMNCIGSDLSKNIELMVAPFAENLYYLFLHCSNAVLAAVLCYSGTA